MPDNDLYALQRDLGEAPREAGSNLRKALQVTAGGVKRDWRKYLRESDNAGIRNGANSIDYDIDDNASDEGSSLEVVIGNKVGGSGSLVFINEFGSLATGPRGSGASALRDNAADFDEGVNKAINDALNGLGL